MLLSEARRVVAVVAAFAAGVILAWVPFSSEPLPFRETSRYPMWVFLIAIACASCPIVWSHGTSALAKLPAHRPPMLEALAYGAWTIALTVGLLVVPAALPSRGSPPVPLPNLGLRLAVVYLAVILAAAPGTIAMYRIWEACQRGDGEVADLVAWRSILQSQLAALGALIALGTLTTAALRNALLAAFTTRPDDFPAEYVLLFGAGLTVVVALLYAPPSERLRRRAQAMVDEAFPVPNQLEGDWQQQLQRRRDLSAVLRTDEMIHNSIQNALIIGGPLITSALTLLVPTD
jgi:lysylphosphatidylglycerol synthetase-like protein (DUF2156 family)